MMQEVMDIVKTIKINFVDFWPGFNKTNNFIYNHLQKTYKIDISEHPDYVFCSFFGEEHWKYSYSIKIYYTGENIIPDFNIFDYAMGFNYINFEDRYLRMPIYLIQNNDSFEPPFYGNLVQQVMNKNDFDCLDFKKKTEFCSFVYSNSKACSKRREFFELLSEYKKVNSGGRFLNNVGGPVEDKMEFQLRHKFAIAFENSQYPGYVTEKIMEAFAAQTIPIYWGDPVITRTFNPKAFVNCNDYANFEQVVERVKEIDQDDDLYCSMMR